jgi:hypothetical protein
MIRTVSELERDLATQYRVSAEHCYGLEEQVSWTLLRLPLAYIARSYFLVRSASHQNMPFEPSVCNLGVRVAVVACIRIT